MCVGENALHLITCKLFIFFEYGRFFVFRISLVGYGSVDDYTPNVDPNLHYQREYGLLRILIRDTVFRGRDRLFLYFFENLFSDHLIFITGATIGYFPVDQKSLEYLRQTNRDEDKIQLIQAYLTAVGMLR